MCQRSASSFGPLGGCHTAKMRADSQWLVADAIKDVSKRKGIVLDPFGGSGTTIIAAEKTGRRARAIELDPKYVDVAVRRWERYTARRRCLTGPARPLRTSRRRALRRTTAPWQGRRWHERR